MSDPNHAASDADTVLYQEARALLATGQFSEACQRLEASSRLRPHFKTLELLGECYLHLDRPSDAIVPLAAASFLSRQFRAPTLLAEAFFRINDLRAARDAVEAALRVNPQYRRAINLRRLIVEHSEQGSG